MSHVYIQSVTVSRSAKRGNLSSIREGRDTDTWQHATSRGCHSAVRNCYYLFLQCPPNALSVKLSEFTV